MGVGGIWRINILITGPENIWLTAEQNSYSCAPSTKTHKPLCSLQKRKPSDRLNTDTETSQCAYYLARHKTTGARGWMSILCILVRVYTPLTVLKNLSFNHNDPTAPDLSPRTAHDLSFKHHELMQLVEGWCRKGAAGWLETKLPKAGCKSVGITGVFSQISGGHKLSSNYNFT